MTTVVTRMIGFIMTPIYTRSLSNPAVYGVFTNLYAYAALINAVLAFGMETTFFRYLNRVENSDKARVYNNSFLITVLSSIIFVTTIYIFSDPIGAWLASNSSSSTAAEYTLFVKYFGVILAADALAVVPFAKLRAEGRPLRYSFIKLINIFILIGANLFFLFGLPNWVEGSLFWQQFAEGWFVQGWIGYVFLANLIASISTLILLTPQIFQFRFEFDRLMMKQMLNYSFPILIANISFIINEHLDKMMFPSLMPGNIGEDELGVYGAVAKLAIFLNLFVTAFRLGVEPFFFSHAKEKNAGKTYALIMDYFIIIMVMVMVGICANMDWLKYFISGKDDQIDAYWSGLFIIPILLLNNVLLGIYMNLSVWYKLSDQTRYALYISGIGALITIVLNLLFIPAYSYLGACLSTTVAYIIMVGLSYFWGQRNYPIPYHTHKNIAYILLGIMASGLIFYVFDTNVWISNAILILLLFGVVLREKNDVLKFLKK